VRESTRNKPRETHSKVGVPDRPLAVRCTEHGMRASNGSRSQGSIRRSAAKHAHRIGQLLNRKLLLLHWQRLHSRLNLVQKVRVLAHGAKPRRDGLHLGIMHQQAGLAGHAQDAARWWWSWWWWWRRRASTTFRAASRTKTLRLVPPLSHLAQLEPPGGFDAKHPVDCNVPGLGEDLL
jgi:hypothetical protein